MTPPARWQPRLACCLAVALIVGWPVFTSAQPPEPVKPGLAEGPAITELKGLMVPQFEVEMRHFVQALGVNCGGCHVRGNFASEENPRKAVARKMIVMTRRLNERFFPGFIPAEGESSLGRVTCYTCHQGNTQPKADSGPRP